MTKPLAFAAVVEVATGVALAAAPSFVARLLFGAELTGIATVAARVAGIGLLSLGIACWPLREPARPAQQVGMAAYGLLITFYLLYLGVRGEWVGPLLWPAVLLHVGITWLLGRGWLRARSAVAKPPGE